MRKKTSLKFLIIVSFLFLSSCSSAQNNSTAKDLEVKRNDKVTAAPDIGNLLKKQILLTNDAQFTNDRTLEGASGFLIKYNGANFAVTARHLLGEAGGVEPEIKINDLSKSLSNWEMKPRVVTKAVKETIKLSAEGFDYSQSDKDIVLLKVVSNDFEIERLTPDFELPAIGETLFLIGCPYSETDCKQNSYPIKFVEFDETENALIGETSSKIVLSGFSGAPVVNGRGAVVAVLISGGAVGGKKYVMATHIKEIKKIKF